MSRHSNRLALLDSERRLQILQQLRTTLTSLVVAYCQLFLTQIYDDYPLTYNMAIATLAIESIANDVIVVLCI